MSLLVIRSNSNRSANDTTEMLKGKKLGHRRVKGGEVTYKKFETTPLMRSIQLGIHQSVGNLASQEDRDILHEDFYTVETVVFSRYLLIQHMHILYNFCVVDTL